MTKNRFVLLLSFLMALVFLWAGISKLFRPESFLEAIRGYGEWAPAKVELFLVYWVPVFEIMLGLGFFFHSTRGASSLLAVFLLGAFMILIGSAWWRGLSPSCGCFGFQWDLHPFWQILRNSLLVIFSLGILRGDDRLRISRSNGSTRAVVLLGCLLFGGIPMDLDAQPEWEKTQRFETVLKGVPSVDQRFSFVNKGDEPLVIESVKPSCGCVVPEYSQQPIPAGGTGYVKVVFKPGERVGLQRETIRVSFEGNKEFSQTLVLRIDVQEKVEIHPQMVHWIRGDDFTPREINYQIHESLSWKLKSVKMEGDAFSVDHTVLSEDDFRKGVITVNRLKSGEHREEVLLVFTEAESSGGEGENAPEDVERKLIVRSLR